MMFSAIYQPCLTACQVKVLQIDVDKYFRKEKQAEKIVEVDAGEARFGGEIPNSGVYSCAIVCTFDTLAVRFS